MSLHSHNCVNKKLMMRLRLRLRPINMVYLYFAAVLILAVGWNWSPVFSTRKPTDTTTGSNISRSLEHSTIYRKEARPLNIFLAKTREKAKKRAPSSEKKQKKKRKDLHSVFKVKRSPSEAKEPKRKEGRAFTTMSPTVGPPAGNRFPVVFDITQKPFAPPIFSPSGSPTVQITVAMTGAPTDSPIPKKTSSPTRSPTARPTVLPTGTPISRPPTGNPTTAPTSNTAASTTAAPTNSPTSGTTVAPSKSPTNSPTEAPSIAPTPRSATSPPTVIGFDPFDITFTFFNTSASNETLVRQAAVRWERVVSSGEDSMDGTGVTSLFAFAEDYCTYPDTIDDLHLCTGVFNNISDGVGGTLAFGGAERTRSNGVPYTGIMAFDPADQHTVDDLVVLHELGHAMGFGTLWTRANLIGAVADGCPYQAEKLTSLFTNVTGCDSVPMEIVNSNPASCGFHFDEDCFQKELMSPTYDSGTDNPLSVFTIAALEDIGYTVDYSAADSFGIDDLNASCVCKRRNVRHLGLPRSGRLLTSDVARAQEMGQSILRERRTIESRDLVVNSIAVLYQGEDGTIGSVITSI